jgi:hypothetical protein
MDTTCVLRSQGQPCRASVKKVGPSVQVLQHPVKGVEAVERRVQCNRECSHRMNIQECRRRHGLVYMLILMEWLQMEGSYNCRRARLTWRGWPGDRVRKSGEHRQHIHITFLFCASYPFHPGPSNTFL